MKITECHLTSKRFTTDILKDLKTFVDHSSILKTFFSIETCPSTEFLGIWKKLASKLDREYPSERNQVIEGTMSRAKLVLIYLKAIELYQWYLWIYAKSIYRSHCNFERKLSNRSRIIQRQNILENHLEIFVLWYRSDGLPCGVDHETIRIKTCFL